MKPAMKEKHHCPRGRIVNLCLFYLSMHLQQLHANSTQKIAPQWLTAGNSFNPLVMCVCEICTRHSKLFWSPTAVLMIGRNQTKAKSEFTEEIIKVLAEKNVPHVLTKKFDTDIFNANMGHFLFIEYFDNNSVLDAEFDVIKKHGKYLWVLDKHSDKFWDVDFQSIGTKVGKYDVTFLLRASEGVCKIVTFIPTVDKKTCKVVVEKSVQINACSNGRLERNLMFPPKNPTNLERCPFKVGLGSSYPFSSIENQKSLKTLDRLQNGARGSDVEMIKIISDYLNATLDLYYIDRLEGNPLDKKEYLPFVVNGSLDACAGGLYRVYGDVVEYSGVYMKQAIGWMYTADRPTINSQNLFKSVDGLYLFIIFYITYSVVWFLICTFDKRTVSMKDTFLYGWGALVGAASLPDAKSLKQKILNVIYLIMCLHLSVYISIQLYSYLTIRGPPAILRSNDDIMSSGRTPFLHDQAKYFVKDEKYGRFANTSVLCVPFSDCYLKILRMKGVTVVNDGYFIVFQAESTVNDEARLLRAADNLLVIYYQMIISKKSPVVTKFQNTVVKMFEAGISLRLFEEAVGINKLQKSRIATQNIMGNSYRCQEGCAINFDHLSGVFFVWLVGCAASCIVFSVELLCKRIRKITDEKRSGFKLE